MTVISTKKTPNNNRDNPSTQQPQQPQQQQQQQQQQQNSETNETNNTSVAQSNITTTNEQYSTITTTSVSPKFPNNSKGRYRHFNQNVNKQTRNELNDSSSDEEIVNDNLRLSSREPVNHQISNEIDQYNSEDEYEHTTRLKCDQTILNEREKRFAEAIKAKKGYIIKPVQEDGACLFRAVSDQVFGNEDMHTFVRQSCMDHIVKNADYFRAYITEDFDRYIERKRRHDCHGNHIEIIALSEIYNRPIEVYEYSIEPINVVHGMYKTDNEPIRLSYHSGVHYNSIIDPWRPTAGHGLGLPNLEPGHAQDSLIRTALQQSEESHIEKTLLDEQLATTDCEATQEEIIQQITRESYLVWLHENSKLNTNNKSTLSSDCPSTTSEKPSNDDQNLSSTSLPVTFDKRIESEFTLPLHYENASSFNFDLHDDNDEESLMNQILVLSQIEYIESLRRQQESLDNNDSNNISSSSSSPDKNVL